MTTIFLEGGHCLQTNTSVKELWDMLQEAQSGNKKFCRTAQLSTILNIDKIIYIYEEEDV